LPAVPARLPLDRLRGGYVGGWLAAWIKREGCLATVEQQLNTNRVEQARIGREVVRPESENAERATVPLPDVLDEEPEPIYHLRSYSRYLTPRPGLMSADAWTFGAGYLRNLFTNLLILIPLVLALVCLSRSILGLYAFRRVRTSRGRGASSPSYGRAILDQPAVRCLRPAAIVTVAAARQRLRLHDASRTHAMPSPSLAAFRWFVVVPLCLAALTGGWVFGMDPETVSGGGPKLASDTSATR
jgi:hypothetical protein